MKTSRCSPESETVATMPKYLKSSKSYANQPFNLLKNKNFLIKHDLPALPAAKSIWHTGCDQE